jgi:hypothetical protein
MLTSIASTHSRHGCPFSSAASSGQVPKPLRGAPKARDLTAKARTELLFIRRQDRLSPTRVPIEKKEIIRWLQNLAQFKGVASQRGRWFAHRVARAMERE